MRKKLDVKIHDLALWLNTDITYGRVPGRFGNVTTDLKMSVIWHNAKSINRPTAAPCIVWLCGGGWMDMSVNSHLMEFAELAKAGYIVASVQYRTGNIAKFPGPLEDIKAAIRYLKANAALYNIDPGRIAIMGESAGGHLAAMVGVTCGMEEFEKGEYLDENSDVKAVCAWYGPFDLPEVVRSGGWTGGPAAIFTGGTAEELPALLKAASPTTYITEKTPPFLLLHGNNDARVDFSQSEILFEKLIEKGVPADLYEIDGAGHAAIHFFQPEVKAIIRDFFDKYLDR